MTRIGRSRLFSPLPGRCSSLHIGRAGAIRSPHGPTSTQQLAGSGLSCAPSRIILACGIRLQSSDQLDAHHDVRPFGGNVHAPSDNGNAHGRPRVQALFGAGGTVTGRRRLRLLRRTTLRQIDLLRIGRDGRVDLDQLRELLRPDTIAVAVTLVDSELGLPETAAVDEAASLVHMMNANTFTAAAYHATGDTAELAQQLRDNIMQRQWMCGFPDKLVVAEVGEYVVTVFGADELVDTFMTHLNGIYGVSATYDEAIL